MKDSLKAIGSAVLGISILSAVLLVIALFITGGALLAEKLLPWLSLLASVVFLIELVIFLPLSLVRAARGFTSVAILISSFVFGLTLWMEGLLLTYAIWGGFAVFIGLFLAGVGVVPIAMLATLVKGMWLPLAELIFLTILTFGSRALAYKIASISGPVPQAISAPGGAAV